MKHLRNVLIVLALGCGLCTVFGRISNDIALGSLYIASFLALMMGIAYYQYQKRIRTAQIDFYFTAQLMLRTDVNWGDVIFNLESATKSLKRAKSWAWGQSQKRLMASWEKIEQKFWSITPIVGSTEYLDSQEVHKGALQAFDMLNNVSCVTLD